MEFTPYQRVGEIEVFGWLSINWNGYGWRSWIDPGCLWHRPTIGYHNADLTESWYHCYISILNIQLVCPPRKDK